MTRTTRPTPRAMGSVALALVCVLLPAPGEVAAQGVPQQDQEQPQAVDRPLDAQLADVGQKLAQSEETLYAQYTALHSQLDALLSAHERAPALVVGSEQQRMVLLKNMLNRVIRLGKPLVEDAEQFQHDFAEWQLASGNAARAYRAAEGHFLKKATDSKYDEEKQFYLTSAKFYAARAARQEVLRERAEPTDIKTELDRVRRLVAAVEELSMFVENDEYVTSSALATSQFSQFMTAFTKTGSILEKWSEVLMQDLIEEEGAPGEASQKPRP